MNFIIVEDNPIFNREIKNIIDKYMFKTTYKYQIYRFLDYNAECLKIMEDDTIKNKIYIFDIECPSSNGIKMISDLRKFDIKSFVILISAYKKNYIEEVSEKPIQFLCFINKDKTFEQKLRVALEYGVTNIGYTNIIQVKKDGILYTIYTEDIETIYTEEDIVYIDTKNVTIDVNKTLKELFSTLSTNFIYCHRSRIVNIYKIDRIDVQNKKLYLKNGSCHSISKRKLKPLLDKYKERCLTKEKV